MLHGATQERNNVHSQAVNSSRKWISSWMPRIQTGSPRLRTRELSRHVSERDEQYIHQDK